MRLRQITANDEEDTAALARADFVLGDVDYDASS
jgi:hypothetical protein